MKFSTNHLLSDSFSGRLFDILKKTLSVGGFAFIGSKAGFLLTGPIGAFIGCIAGAHIGDMATR